MELDKPEVQLLFQHVLGQVLFYPPNVAGWPGGKNWIDSSALMFRLRIPQILANADNFVIRPKDDDDTMMGMEGVDKMERPRQVNSVVDWDSVLKVFDSEEKENLLEKISSIVLQTKDKIDSAVIDKYAGKQTREMYIQTMIVELMSTPEYQLC